jgi:putative transposase
VAVVVAVGVNADATRLREKWSLNRRYMQLEGLYTLNDTVPNRLFAVAR